MAHTLRSPKTASESQSIISNGRVLPCLYEGNILLIYMRTEMPVPLLEIGQLQPNLRIRHPLFAQMTNTKPQFVLNTGQ